MIQKKNGLNDSDKILVTVALWISAITLFATALSLPMLPDKVTIFYHPTETTAAAGAYYSKYNNLFIILISVIPATIVLISASLKKRNRLQNNFLSIVLFSIMLSMSMSAVILYGILQQFDASTAIQFVNVHGIATIMAAFVFSMFAAVLPSFLHGAYNAERDAFSYKSGLALGAVKFWNIGAYGFLLCAIVCTFTPDVYCYIPLAVFLAAYVVFMLVCGKKYGGKA
ncbi:MAG: hypothetical protein K2L54_03025 [Clostridiales bacterium]|nr:hypothetical protein [Clostridiales bacterium]